MAPTKKSRTFKTACVIDEIALRQLGRILSECDASPRFTVYLKDGTVLDFDTVDKVIDIANSKTNPIVGIDARVWDSSQNKEIMVCLANPLFVSSPVHYSITGSEQECILWSQQLDEWVLEVKAWYSRIARVDFVVFNLGLIVITIFTLITIAAIYVLFAGVNTDSSGESDESSPVIVIFSLVVPMAFLLGIFLNIVRNRLFPIWTFAIGYGKKRHETQQRLREFIGITIIVSFLINILAAFVIGGS